MEFGIDISNWSGVPTEVQARKISQRGYARAICGTQNPAILRGQLDVLGQAGLALEAYVYLRFDRPPVEQVNAAIAALGGRVVGRLWLDCEDESASALPPAQVLDFIQRAADACIGVIFAGIYTRRDWWMERTGNATNFQTFPLWDATNDNTPDMGFRQYGGWQQSEMEQYQFNQIVEGINTDLNVFRSAPPVFVAPALPPPPPATPKQLAELALSLAQQGAPLQAIAGLLTQLISLLPG